MIDEGKRRVLGIDIDVVDYDAAVTKIIDAAEENRAFPVSALAVHGVMTGVDDPEHRFRLNRFGLIVPDGQPVRWALNFLYGAKLRDRVYGPELTLRVCAAAAARRLPIFMYGGTREILTDLERSLSRRFPGIVLAGATPSRFCQITREEQDRICANIASSGARIVLVGLGCPRQEVWAYEQSERLQMPLLAVGAAFPFIAGRLAQAPAWMQRAGLEWLFRFAIEPARLWRRYLLLNPAYVALVTMQALGLRRNDSDRRPTHELLFG
jgi:N-acetylglucosaminyldiphosphoundecaprenol N-acetyl-beta-D-mannosaminyltransferase